MTSTKLTSVNALAMLPEVSVETARDKGIPSDDCVITVRRSKLVLGKPDFSYHGTELLDDVAQKYYYRPTIYPTDLYLVSLKDAQIDGTSVVHKNGRLYPEGFRSAIYRNVAAAGTAPVGGEPLECGEHAYDYTLSHSDTKPVHIKGTALLLKSTHSTAWAFWQMDTAAKVYYWQKMGKPTDWIFLVDENIPEYQLEVYRSVGVEDHQFQRITTKTSYQIEHLLVGSPLAVWNGGFSSEYSDFWQTICLGISERSGLDLEALREERKDKLVYISREDVPLHRPGLNISEIEKILRNENARFVVPGKLSLTEKVEAFYGYNCIVGALGSGTNNVIFGGDRGHFMGLWQWYLSDRYIVDLCESLGRSPHLLFCDGFFTDAQSERMKYKAPFVIDPSKFSDLLKYIQAQPI